MTYYPANEDYELGCADSAMGTVNLSSCSPVCFTAVKATSLKACGKNCLTSLSIAVTPATGMVKTSLIDGASVTFVSASGSISGSSDTKSGNMALLLADDQITGATVSAYTGKGSVGTLVVNGVNASSGAPVVDSCKVWIKKAGQTKVKVA